MSGRSGFEAVLLAAGASTRMGAPKALLDWCGLPLVAFQAIEFLNTRIDRLVVVLGARAEETRRALEAGLAVRPVREAPARLAVVVNAQWERGKCGSIRAGVGALSKGARDIAVHSVDQPTSAEVLEALFALHRKAGSDATVPVCGERRGHPVVLRSTLRGELLHLREEERGLRGLVGRLEREGRLALAPLSAPCTLWNINSPADLPRPTCVRPSARKDFESASTNCT